MDIKYYDLCYTVTKNRSDKEIVNDEFENKENGYINFEVFITPNQNFGRQNDEEMLR